MPHLSPTTLTTDEQRLILRATAVNLVGPPVRGGERNTTGAERCWSRYEVIHFQGLEGVPSSHRSL